FRSLAPLAGTVNIVAILPVAMTDAALVNAVMTMTEAKTQALLEAGYPCTGTASDAVCLAVPDSGPQEVFCGPRSEWGSRLARAVHTAGKEGASSWRPCYRRQGKLAKAPVGKGRIPDTGRVTIMATSEPTTTSTVLPGRPPFTVDDLLKFPDDGNRYELFNGSLLVSPAPTPLHQRVIFRLQRVLDDASPPELEPLSTVNLRVSDKDFFIPDLVVVPMASTEQVELMFSPEHLLLAVEIVSPSTKARDRALKV